MSQVLLRAVITFFAGTNDGIWRLPLSALTSAENTLRTGVITSFRLHLNYPNPFNPSTTISYDVPTRSVVTLKIFNVLGQEIATLVNDEAEAGRHQVQWNAAGLPSGVYVYQLKANEFMETKKMVLVR